MTIDISKSLVYDDGFPRVPNIMYRMYPLLDDFTVETTGFYGYLLTWRQNKRDHVMYGKAWLNLDEMEAQTGISKYKIRKHTEVLIRYGLLRVTKSRRIPNKKIYEVLDPITEAEFRLSYSETIDRFGEKLLEIERGLEADRIRLAEIKGATSKPIGNDENGEAIYF